MPKVLDNIAALRILWLLVTPFESYDAYKLGLIDANGNRIKKAKTPEEVAATNMLFRLVWNIKRFVNLVPGGSSKLGSMVAAYALVKECIDTDNYTPSTEQLTEAYDETYADEEIEELLVSIIEDAPANATGSAVSTNVPTGRRKVGKFICTDSTFDKFSNGKAKFRRWASYLNLEDEHEKKVYDFAKKHPRGILILSNARGQTKGIRYSKTGGGNWHGISRKPKQIVEAAIVEYDIEVTDFV